MYLFPLESPSPPPTPSLPCSALEWCCCLLLPYHPLLPSAGVTPSHTTFSMHALLVDHYLKGAFYPRGGSSEIAFHTIPVIQRAGGAVLTRAPVHSILLDSAGKACGESPAVFTVLGAGGRDGGTEQRRLRGQRPPDQGLQAGICRKLGLPGNSH